MRTVVIASPKGGTLKPRKSWFYRIGEIHHDPGIAGGPAGNFATGSDAAGSGRIPAGTSQAGAVEIQEETSGKKRGITKDKILGAPDEPPGLATRPALVYVQGRRQHPERVRMSR